MIARISLNDLERLEHYMPLFCSHCGSENRNDASVCQKCDARIGHVGDQANSETQSPDARSTFSSDSPLVWVATAAVCALYLTYPSLGIFELIPDSLPLVGSLDEAGATTGLLYALFRLGWIPLVQPKKK